MALAHRLREDMIVRSTLTRRYRHWVPQSSRSLLSVLLAAVVISYARFHPHRIGGVVSQLTPLLATATALIFPMMARVNDKSAFALSFKLYSDLPSKKKTAPALKTLLSDYWPVDEPSKWDGRHTDALIAYHTDTPVGVQAFYAGFAEAAHTNGLYVAPAMRGKKIGTALRRELALLLWNAGIKRLWINVRHTRQNFHFNESQKRLPGVDLDDTIPATRERPISTLSISLFEYVSHVTRHRMNSSPREPSGLGFSTDRLAARPSTARGLMSRPRSLGSPHKRDRVRRRIERPAIDVDGGGLDEDESPGILTEVLRRNSDGRRPGRSTRPADSQKPPASRPNGSAIHKRVLSRALAIAA